MTSRRSLVARLGAPLLFLVAALPSCGGGGGGGGEPGVVDLGIDEARLASSVIFTEETFAPDHCAVVEGAVEPGTRRLCRFDTVVVNWGTADYVLGDPADPIPPVDASDFEFSPCHGHYHLHDWADYRIEDDAQNVVAQGHKQAFCLRDNLAYAGGLPTGYDCEFQGISAGWADLYSRDLDGQWVDVTDLAPGDYWLVVEVDLADYVPEPNETHPNLVRVPITVPSP